MGVQWITAPCFNMNMEERKDEINNLQATSTT